MDTNFLLDSHRYYKTWEVMQKILISGEKYDDKAFYDVGGDIIYDGEGCCVHEHYI